MEHKLWKKLFQPVQTANDHHPWSTIFSVTVTNNKKKIKDEQPLEISDKSQQVVSEIKCCNYQFFNFVENNFKVKK